MLTSWVRRHFAVKRSKVKVTKPNKTYALFTLTELSANISADFLLPVNHRLCCCWLFYKDGDCRADELLALCGVMYFTAITAICVIFRTQKRDSRLS